MPADPTIVKPLRRPTPTQERVAELVARGLSYAEIARLMGIAPRTVRAHVATLDLLLAGLEGLPPKTRVYLAAKSWERSAITPAESYWTAAR